MRVAYLTGTYPRATDTFIQREVAELRRLGDEVHTFAVRAPGDEHLVGPRQRDERARTTYLLPAPTGALLGAHGRLLARSPRRYGRAARLAWATRAPGVRGTLRQLAYLAEAGLLAAELRRRRLRHLHNHLADSSATVAMLAAELGGATFSFTLHGPGIFFEAVRWRLDEKVRRAALVVCISAFARSQAMLFSPTAHWGKLRIVHCGVDPAALATVEHHDRGRRLLYVGRLAAAKGVPVLLESVRALRDRGHDDVELTLVGDGDDRDELERLAARLGVERQVRLAGYLDEDGVREHLRSADVFVLPSFAEGVPVSLMEAMGAGVPVVATAVGGVGELVHDGVDGYVVPPGDVDALTDRLARLLADGPLRARLGAAGRATVARSFDVRREAAALHDLLAPLTR